MTEKRRALAGLGLALGLEAGLVWLLFLNVIPPLTLYGRALHVLWLLGLLFALSVQAYWLRALRGRGLRALGLAAVTLGLIVGGVCCGETLFRLNPIYDSFDYNPGVKHFWPDWVYYKPNNFGHRDRDFPRAKPEGTYRILVAGDSFTEGAGVSRDQTFCRVLEAGLNAGLAGTGRRVEVFNLGHCGLTTVEEVALLLAQAPRLSPDMILLAYVYNDPEINDPPVRLPPDRDLGFLAPWPGLALAQAAAPASDASAPPAVAPVPPHKTCWQRVRHFAITRLHSYLAYFLHKYGTFSNEAQGLASGIAALHSDANPGWPRAKAAMARLAAFARENRITLVGLVFPVFLDISTPAPIPEALGKARESMAEAGFSQVIDLAPVFASARQGATLGEFMLSRFDGHPNAGAHELLGRWLAVQLPHAGTLRAFMEAPVPASGP